MTPRSEARQRIKMALARKKFFWFCNVLAPDFYKEDRQYLVDMCNEMQDFYESDDEVLIITVPPRHGKSRTASMFSQWVFGKEPSEKIMTGSYNETLSRTFSKSVRNGISEVKADEDLIVYSDLFPNTRIKRGEAAMNLWALDGGYNNYLATSPGGTATGFGASILLIDDLIKNSLEAYNEMVLEKHWDWFTNTMLSRLEEGGKIIIIMTRWATGDLAGRALAHFKSEGKRMRHINLKALQDDGTMLCDEVLSRRSFDSKCLAMGDDIARANYQQEPLDAKGKLYKKFSTYNELPKSFERIISYTDTADDGADFLCSIIAGEYKQELYVLDVVYTQDGMEVTEPLVAEHLVRFNATEAEIESNNGGKGFARNVRRILLETHNMRKPRVRWFHQSDNKKARILSASVYVMDHVLYPSDWARKWPDYYDDMNKYQKAGKNIHDDAPDATTGLVEMISKKRKASAGARL